MSTATATVPNDGAPTKGVAPERARRFGPRRREVQAALEIFAVCGLAFAQPTFDLLGKNTGIFATRRSSSFDLIVVSFAILLAPAVVLYVAEVVLGVILPMARRFIHGVVCGIPIGVLAEEILKRNTELPHLRLIHLGVLSGIVGAILVMRVDLLRMWLRFLAFAPALFAALFLFGSPASAVVFGGTVESASGVVAKHPKRVIEIVFDEFPEMSMLDGSGKIDAQLFPNFAKLAGESTWYRNDTTVAPYTERAVPAILTGRLPPAGNVVPSSADYPQNLFTLLGGVYPLNVHEGVTSLCPTKFCAAKATNGTGVKKLKLLGVDAYHLWREFASPKRSVVDFSEKSVVQYGIPQANKFIASLAPSKEPQLDFVHIELPHEPWHLLPSGQDNLHYEPQQGASKLEWQKDAWPAESARLQHLLQVQATDAVLGRMIDRIKQVGAWKDSMVVVTADHGVSFTPLQGIRSVTAVDGGRNYPEIMWTPLFIKYPGQPTGVVDDRPAQSIDVLPTIADVIGVKIPWKIDGTSLLGPVRPDFPRTFDQAKGNSFGAAHALFPKKGKRYLTFDPSAFQDVIKSQAVAPGGDPKLRIYRSGPFGALVGQSVASVPTAPTSTPTLIHVGGVPKFDFIIPNDRIAPWAYVEGVIDNISEDTWMVVALNGKIAGIGQGLPFQNSQNGTLTAIVSPEFVVQGKNELAVYAVGGTPAAPTLRPVPVYRGPGE